MLHAGFGAGGDDPGSFDPRDRLRRADSASPNPAPSNPAPGSGTLARARTQSASNDATPTGGAVTGTNPVL